MSAHAYTAWVHREDGWLVIRIPELGQVAQARRHADVELTAKACIASTLDVEIDDIEVEIKREF